MGKAHAGTETNAKGRYGIGITHHAMESLRARLHENGASSKFSYEPDSSLELRLGEAIKHGISLGRYKEEGKDVHEAVYLGESFSPADLVAFLRGGKCLTVLTRNMVNRSIDQKRWVRVDVPSDSPFAKLSEVLAHVPPSASPPPARSEHAVADDDDQEEDGFIVLVNGQIEFYDTLQDALACIKRYVEGGTDDVALFERLTLKIERTINVQIE